MFDPAPLTAPHAGGRAAVPQRMRKFWHAEARAGAVAAGAEQQPALQRIATQAGGVAPVKASGKYTPTSLALANEKNGVPAQRGQRFS